MDKLMTGNNISSLFIRQQIGQATGLMQSSVERLATGMRINSVSDDAAALAVSQEIIADSRVYRAAVGNVNNALSLLAFGDAALSELSGILNRQMDLARQASNTQMTYERRAVLDEEFSALIEEYNRIVSTTEFNGVSLLGSGGTTYWTQAGYGSDNAIPFTIGENLVGTQGSGELSEINSITESTLFSSAVVSGDINGDGIPDLVTVGMVMDGYTMFGQASVYFGNGDGTFSLSGTYLTNNFNTQDLALADLDGDGYLDLVTTGQEYDGANLYGQISVWMNDGSGSFVSRQTVLAENMDSSAVLVADLDGDGIFEIITAGSTLGGTGEVTVYANDGSGNITRDTTYAIGQVATYGLAVGDLDGDGYLDIAAGGISASSGVVSVLINDGSGGFTLDTVYDMETTATTSLAIADVDYDGSNDIITGGQSTDGVNFWGEVNIRLGNGDGSFNAASSYVQNGFSTASVIVGDADWDGVLDIITSGISDMYSGPGTTVVRLGNADGTFAAGQTFVTSEYQTMGVLLADLDGDGVSELINAGDNSISASNGTITILSSGWESTDIGNLNIRSVPAAEHALEQLGTVLEGVQAEQGIVGSAMSRFGITLEYLRTHADQLDAASARITDVDTATEVANMVKAKILLQSGVAALAHSNQSAALVLKLIANTAGDKDE